MFQRGVKVLIIVFINKRLSTHDLVLAVHGGPRLDRTLVKPSVVWRMPPRRQSRSRMSQGTSVS